MLDVYLACIGALAVGVALVSKRMRDLPLSEPLLALVLGVAIGPRVLGWVDLGGPGQQEVLLEASRILLAVSLMAIGLRYPLDDLKPLVPHMVLLVVVVMPAMAVVSALLAGWWLGIPATLAWLIGACVAPTDPVLASSVVTGESAERLVPARLRQLLSAEAGANDGLALPLVVVGIALVDGRPGGGLAAETLWAVLGAVALGLVTGLAAGRVMNVVERHHDVEPSVSLLFTLVLAVFVLGVGELARTAAILAVFVAGLAFNAVISRGDRGAQESIDEGVNRFVVLPLFTLLGVALPWTGWGELGWPVVGLAASVLVLRRLPLIAAVHRPLRFSWPDVAFYGWFGPMGASALFYVTHAHAEGADDPVVWHAVSLTITASVVLHGTTSAPGRRRYAAWQRPR